MCGIAFLELLDAAHIISHKEAGTHDPRNGMILCASHHRAFDAGLFAIEPQAWQVRLAAQVPDAEAWAFAFLRCSICH
ncbi:MAG: HNH endonuclease [Blastocatellia bacterium]